MTLVIIMKCNILHINFKKCCYMHFTPNRNDIVPNDGTLPDTKRVSNQTCDLK